MRAETARLLVSAACLAGSAAFFGASLPRKAPPYGWRGEGYSIRPLIYVGNEHVFGLVGFNDEGHIVGSGPNRQGRFTAQLYDLREARDLGCLPGYDGSRAYGPNNADLAVGSSYRSVGSYSLRPTKACFWDASGVHPLPALPGFPCCRAWAVNDAGVIVGLSYKPESEERNAASQPTVWRDGKAAPLPLPPGAQQAEAKAVNAGGDVIGTAMTKDGKSMGCLWAGGKAILLPPLPGDAASEAAAINDKGQVVGLSDRHVVIWSGGGAPERLPAAPGAIRFRPVGINDQGVVVLNDQGEIVKGVSDGITLPFVYFPGRGYLRVSHLVPSGTGYDFAKMLGVNGRGQIAVGARHRGREASVYLLSPPDLNKEHS